MRDWKEVSKVSSEAHPGGVVFLDSPHFPVSSLPGEAAPFYHDLTLEVGGNDLSPKEIRRFLWEHRNSRAICRDRCFIETLYDEDSDVSTVKIGTMTGVHVLERMTDGS